MAGIVFDNQTLAQGVADPQVMFTVLIGIFVVGFIIGGIWFLYNMIK